MTTRFFSRRSALALALASLLSACNTLSDSSESPKPSAAAVSSPDIGLYELRVYTAADGKFDQLVARVRDHEAPLFKKHGMIPVGFFTPASGPGQSEADRIYCILAYKDRAARDKAWTEFSADPDWKAAYRTTAAGGALQSKIDNVFLSAASYSPKPHIGGAARPRLFELRTYTANPGKLEAIHARFRDHTKALFARHGMTSILYWRPTPGQEGGYDQKLVYMLAYPDLAARNADWAEFSEDPEWVRVSAESQKDGLLLKGRPDSVLLTPTSFSPLR